MTRLLLTTAFALAAQAVLADEIRVLNWQGYGTDIDWSTKAFTEATGNTVVHEYFTSEQEMLTKLRTNPGAYDVVLINSAFTAQAQAEGLIGPIDAARIPNFKDVDPAFIDSRVRGEDAKDLIAGWLGKLTAPALVIAGEPRLGASFDDAAEWKLKKGIASKDLTVKRFPGTGHVIHGYRPEQFLENLEPFLRRLRTPAPAV